MKQLNEQFTGQMNPKVDEKVKNHIDEHRMEIENRIKNLCWTVSGDYSLNIKPDIETFARSKYIALYDAIKQGAFGKYFDAKELSLYILKKISMSAEEKPLLELSQICVDVAVYPVISRERRGVDTVRIKAYQDILQYQNAALNRTFFGSVKKAIIEGSLIQTESKSDEAGVTKTVNSLQTCDCDQGETNRCMNPQQIAEELNRLKTAQSTTDIIKVIDYIYNSYFDHNFEKKHGDLEKVLKVSKMDIMDSFWQECMSDDEMEDNRILIILSDGRPCDMGTNRPGTRKIDPYIGEDAIKDTAFEVRRARAQGIFVLGVFAGSEEDLPAEKKIYGKDFAYIRNISNFSKIVGSYLCRQINNGDD